ncbi:Pectic enzymes secretion protein outO [Chromobacterium vaccinii]|nr:Pectic enzymes secretion protein outO [Chromobacterium vaccinii]
MTITQKNLLAIGGAIIVLLMLSSWLGLNGSRASQTAFALMILGMTLGSFLNVLTFRLPKMLEYRWRIECADASGQTIAQTAAMTLSRPRSHCPACQTPLAAWQLMPVLSFLLLRGRCASCAVKISPRYPLVELGLGLAFACIGWNYGIQPTTPAYLVLIFLLTALALIDCDVKLLPDALTQALLWSGLACNLFQLFAPLQDAVIGAMAGYLGMWLIAAAFRLCAGKDGLGRGDFKLMAGIGAWLGWQQLPLTLGAGAICSALCGGILIHFKRMNRDTPQAFGPYLIAAAWLAMLRGNEIIGWYFSLVPGHHTG